MACRDTSKEWSCLNIARWPCVPTQPKEKYTRLHGKQTLVPSCRAYLAGRPACHGVSESFAGDKVPLQMCCSWQIANLPAGKDTTGWWFLSRHIALQVAPLQAEKAPLQELEQCMSVFACNPRASHVIYTATANTHCKSADLWRSQAAVCT